MKDLLKRASTWLAGAAAAIMLSTAPTIAQETSTWDQIQETGKLRMGILQAPPWFSKNPATGAWDSGLGVTIGQNMAETPGAELEFVEVT